MEKVTLDIPTMYGDHHVLAVHGILAGLRGVHRVYASSAFQQVTVEFDPTQIALEQIETALTGHGYTPGERPAVAQLPTGRHLRYVTAHGAAQDVVRFTVGLNDDRPIIPCPGFEPRPIRGEHPGDRE